MIYLVSNQTYIEYPFESSTIQECVEYLRNRPVLALDIETTVKYNHPEAGLDPYLSKIIMLQIGDQDREYIIDVRNVDIKPLFEILSNPEVTFIGHNIKFEYKHILHNYNIRLVNVWDTMLVEQILFCGYDMKFDLASVVYRRFKIKRDKETRNEFLSIGSKPFTVRQIQYGANDIKDVFNIWTEQLKEVEFKKLYNCVYLEMQFVKVLGDVEYKGINFNREKWLKNAKKNNDLKIKVEEELNNLIISYFPSFINKQLDLFSGVTCGIKWSSSKQVSEFFDSLGLCPKVKSKTTGKLALSVNAKEMQKILYTLSSDDEIYRKLIETYIRYKEYEQATTTFGEDFLKWVNPITKRIHSDYKQILNTGRISSTRPNLQNIPREDGFRMSFDALKGKKIVNADFSSQESVVMANKSKDKALVEFFLNGDGDFHSYVATLMYRVIDNDPTLKIPPKELQDGSDNPDFKPEHKDKRYKAKILNFSLNYGASAYSLKHSLGGISETEAQKFIDMYYGIFTDLQNYFRKELLKVRQRGYILMDEITNRKFWIINTSDEQLSRLNKNYPIQGTSGSITKYACVLYRKWILDNHLEDKVFITNIIHDEINVECDEEVAQLAATNLELAMKKAGSVWCTIVPLSAKAVISDYWTH